MARSDAPAGAPFLPAALGALGAQRPATSATASAAAAVHAIQLFLLRVMTLSPFSASNPKFEISSVASGRGGFGFQSLARGLLFLVFGKRLAELLDGDLFLLRRQDDLPRKHDGHRSRRFSQEVVHGPPETRLR